ncbi:hypothetical protein DB41_FR00060, partial [Neochlamydia sp. TUME1]|uniref:transposase n=1 Tax=Neochlamydia sp. TUME1 TaxID=1478174 RepID=UPI0005838538
WCEILFLPPYSPDLNPIETFWANFKKIVAANISNTLLSYSLCTPILHKIPFVKQRGIF